MIVAVLAAAALAPPPLLYQTDPASGNAAVYVLTAHGGRRLTSDPSDNFTPAWSPDGKSIAFASSRYQADSGWIFVMGTDGRHVRELTFGGHTSAQDGGDDSTPSWSPDGKHIAFADNQHIDVMDADGRHRHVIIQTPGQQQYNPAWSPDGRRIAYAVGDENDRGIWSAAADGTNKRELTAPPPATTYDFAPAWSPNGKQIAFTRTVGGGSQIWVMNADGSGQRQLTSGSNNEAPTWSPDGHRLAFASDRAQRGHRDIYVMASTGGGAARVTHCRVSCTDPDWRR